jgi:hypothetical protein
MLALTGDERGASLDRQRKSGRRPTRSAVVSWLCSAIPARCIQKTLGTSCGERQSSSIGTRPSSWSGDHEAIVPIDE